MNAMDIALTQADELGLLLAEIAELVVRPDGSHSWSNVQIDSELYAALNAALFNNTTSGA